MTRVSQVWLLKSQVFRSNLRRIRYRAETSRKSDGKNFYADDGPVKWRHVNQTHCHLADISANVANTPSFTPVDSIWTKVTNRRQDRQNLWKCSHPETINIPDFVRTVAAVVAVWKPGIHQFFHIQPLVAQ